jgi:hypothetical protein
MLARAAYQYHAAWILINVTTEDPFFIIYHTSRLYLVYPAFSHQQFDLKLFRFAYSTVQLSLALTIKDRFVIPQLTLTSHETQVIYKPHPTLSWCREERGD